MAETISRPFTFVKDGVFYFSRRIPNELKCHCKSPRIAFSLRTKSARIAEARARKATDQLDEYWYYLRCQDAKLPGKHMPRENGSASISASSAGTAPVVSSSTVLLSEAVRIICIRAA
jgi:hypothetical protein